ncbi:MAG TPA: hypothetical protein VMT91_10535 [Anaerolineales bacterium]|nr:hypothetical protein [Anaerolineales bacterium]
MLQGNLQYAPAAGKYPQAVEKAGITGQQLPKAAAIVSSPSESAANTG